MDGVSGYQPKQVVTSVDELATVLGEQFDSQVDKVIDHVDEHCRVWIERSPFVVLSTSSAAGAMDVSPKGDPPGFVRVLDPKTLAVPDRLVVADERTDGDASLASDLGAHADLRSGADRGSGADVRVRRDVGIRSVGASSQALQLVRLFELDRPPRGIHVLIVPPRTTWGEG